MRQHTEIDWPIFAYSSALGLDRIRLYANGSRCAITSKGEPIFTMDDDEVRDLIDALQKYLAVRA